MIIYIKNIKETNKTKIIIRHNISLNNWKIFIYFVLQILIAINLLKYLSYCI